MSEEQLNPLGPYYTEQDQAKTVEHFVSKSSTDEAEKDLWQTPLAIFNALDKEFEFDVDVFASNKNNLCVDYFTAEHSAFDNEFYKEKHVNSLLHRNYFANPPFSITEKSLNRCSEQARKHNITVVALVNANTDTQWFASAAKSANEIRLLTGRISFVKPSGTTGKGQNSKGQCLIIWRGNCKTPCQITMVDRKTLERK